MTTKRRGHNEGSIRQRADGTWEARVSLPGGRRKSCYGKTRKAAQDALRGALRDLDAGLDLAAGRQTVGQFLTRWLADTVQPNRAPKTYASYAEIVRLHAVPALGHLPLATLQPQHVAALLRAKTEAGLSPRRVHHIRAVLRTALNQAMRWGLVGRNAAALTEAPRQAAAEVVPLSVADARAVLAVAEGDPASGVPGDRLAALFRVALTLGLRQGEVLGLRWRDVDLDGGRLHVRHALQRIDGALILKEPKTEKSRRTLRLPASLLAALRAHRVRQLEERLLAGDRWRDTGHVFASTIGTPLDPRNVIRAWHRLLAQANVTRRPFHTCRHTAASLLLAEGVPLKIVQEVLGHSLLSTTADTYAHLTPAAFQEAADAMERALVG